MGNMYVTKVNLVLASASPRRRELLSRVGIVFSVIPSNLNEDELVGSASRDPRAFAEECSRTKADKVAERMPAGKDCWFLGVDTIVVIDGKILGKPKDRTQARVFLKMLSGRWHKVITGYHLFHPANQKRQAGLVESEVLIRKISATELEAYLRTDEPYDKAGAYAAQGVGAGLIEAIKGSYTNVVGLPLAELIKDMLKLRLIEPKHE